MRLATLQDLPQLIELMRGYYRDDGLEFEAERATATMSRLLSEPLWGRVYLIEDGGGVHRLHRDLHRPQPGVRR